MFVHKVHSVDRVHSGKSSGPSLEIRNPLLVPTSLVSQRLNRVEVGGFESGVGAEHNSNDRADQKSVNDPIKRYDGCHFEEEGGRVRPALPARRATPSRRRPLELIVRSRPACAGGPRGAPLPDAPRPSSAVRDRLGRLTSHRSQSTSMANASMCNLPPKRSSGLRLPMASSSGNMIGPQTGWGLTVRHRFTMTGWCLRLQPMVREGES